MAVHHTMYKPQSREWQAAVAVGSKLYMWGGWAGSKEMSREITNSVEILDMTMELWEQKRPPGTPPSGLCYTVVGPCLFVFGESGGRSHHNSLLKLHMHTLQWEKVRASNPSSGPQRKTNFGMVSDGDNQLMLYFLVTQKVGEHIDCMPST